MTTTTEGPDPSTKDVENPDTKIVAKPAKQTLLERLQAKEIEATAEVEAARARLAAYPEQLREAREQSWYSSPQRKPGSELNGDVKKLIDREQIDLAKMRTLELDLSSLRSAIANEWVRQAERDLLEIRKKDQQERARQSELLKQASEMFVELFDTFNDLLAAAEDHARARAVARQALPEHLAGYLDSEGPALLLSPMPSTFLAFVRLLYGAATSDEVRSEPYEVQMIDSGPIRLESGVVVSGVRPAGVELIETRKRLDDRDILVELVPDLRGSVRKVQLGGNVSTISE
jgi:hypothetical protein